MRKILASVSASALLGFVSGVNAAEDSTSKQIQMLNSQIQSQIQQMQEVQRKNDKAYHDKIQAQLKQIQMDIQKQISQGYNQTEEQIKKVQDTLQKEIKQVKEDVDSLAKATETKR